MYWSVALLSDEPYMYVLAVDGKVDCQEPHQYHTDLEKTFIFYENWYSYNRNTELPHWRLFDRINNDCDPIDEGGCITLNNNTPYTV